MNKFELQGFKEELVKEAKVFGVAFPDPIYSGRVPFEEAHSLYKDYVHTKAKEDPTPMSKALLTGAGVGAGVGLLSALPAPGAGPKLLLTSLGSVLGAGAGAVIKKVDDWHIDLAKQTAAAEDFEAETKKKLVYELAMLDRREKAMQYANEERRHRELMHAIEKKAGVGSLAATVGVMALPERKTTVSPVGVKMKDAVKTPNPISK